MPLVDSILLVGGIGGVILASLAIIIGLGPQYAKDVIAFCHQTFTLREDR